MGEMKQGPGFVLPTLRNFCKGVCLHVCLYVSVYVNVRDLNRMKERRRISKGKKTKELKNKTKAKGVPRNGAPFLRLAFHMPI